MNKVLIGSSALKHHFPDFNRTPKDLDYALTDKSQKEHGEDSMVIPLVVENSTTDIASPEMLLTLKISHIFWKNNWEKHMWDIQFLLGKGVDYDWDLMLKLKDFWTTHYGLIRSNLTLNADKFFDNALPNSNVHDVYHLFINPDPTYLKVLKDGCEVEPCPDKYSQMTHQEKIDLFQEEVMVMGWERYRQYHHKKAYFIMCKKFIRNHTPLFTLDFVLRNYIQLSKSPYDFIEKINKQTCE